MRWGSEPEHRAGLPRAGLAAILLVAGLFATAASRAGADPVIAAAGDIACSPSSQTSTAAPARARSAASAATSDLLVTAASARCSRSATRSTTSGALSSFTKSLRPELGAREADHVPGRRATTST